MCKLICGQARSPGGGRPARLSPRGAEALRGALRAREALLASVDVDTGLRALQGLLACLRAVEEDMHAH